MAEREGLRMVNSLTDGTRPKRTAKRECLKCSCAFESKSEINRLCVSCKCSNGCIADIEIEMPRYLMKRLRAQNKRREGYHG